MKHRVVITGMGIVAPNGVRLEEFKQSIQAGRSGIRFQEAQAELGFGCHVGGIPEVSEEKKKEYLTDIQLRNLRADGIVYGCIAGMDAWKDAGLSLPEGKEQSPDWDSGCMMGAGLAGGDAFRFAVHTMDEKKVKRLGSTMVQQTMSSGISAYLGGILGLGNQVSTNSAACATGTEAIISGYERINMGKARRMLCGGCDSTSEFVWAGFDAMRVLTRKFNDRPEAASRPMSASASGFVPGGGAAALVLESLDSALERGAKIYAEVKGGYVNSGGQQQGGTMTAPNQKGIVRCILGALEDAQVQANKIEAISGHLTSTMFDPYEVRLWTEALGRKGKDFPYINSLKSMTGHCLSAVGAMEAIACVLQLSHGFIHPSLNCEDVHPEIAEAIHYNCIPHEIIRKEIQTVASSSFGFGDVNACVVFGRWNQDAGGR